MRHALDLGGRVASVLAGLDDAIGNRSDMHVRPPARDEHHVGEGGLALQVDGDDVFSLGVFEAVQDRPHEFTGVQSGTFHRGKRRNASFCVHRGCQRLHAP